MRPMVRTHSRHISGRIIRSFPVLKSKHSIKLATPPASSWACVILYHLTPASARCSRSTPLFEFCIMANMAYFSPFKPPSILSLGLCSCCSTAQKIIFNSKLAQWHSKPLFNTQLKFYFLCEVFLSLKLQNPLCSFLYHFFVVLLEQYYFILSQILQ